MSAEQSFDNKIQYILNSAPRSRPARVIKEVMKKAGRLRYYDAFDEFFHRIGVSLNSRAFLDNKGNEIGYLPYIIYKPDNKVGKPTEAFCLIDKEFPVSFEKSYELLAKESIYMLSEVKDISNLIESVYR